MAGRFAADALFEYLTCQTLFASPSVKGWRSLWDVCGIDFDSSMAGNTYDPSEGGAEGFQRVIGRPFGRPCRGEPAAKRSVKPLAFRQETCYHQPIQREEPGHAGVSPERREGPPWAESGSPQGRRAVPPGDRRRGGGTIRPLRVVFARWVEPRMAAFVPTDGRGVFLYPKPPFIRMLPCPVGWNIRAAATPSTR